MNSIKYPNDLTVYDCNKLFTQYINALIEKDSIFKLNFTNSTKDRMYPGFKRTPLKVIDSKINDK